MLPIPFPCRLALAAAVLVAFSARAKKESKDFSNVPTGHDHSAHSHDKHVHVAPHGGTLVEVGDHAYNVEFLRDAAAGKLTAWVLGGHAEDFVRIPAPSFEVVATVAGAKQTLLFKAVANPTTGETVGATSQFEASADWLKTTAAFDGVIPELTIKGTSFKNIVFSLASADAHKH